MSDAAAVIFLIGRILFPLGILISGVTFHIAQSPMAVGYAKQTGFPVPAVAGWVTGVWMTAGSLSVILGVWGDVGALMIAAFVVPAAAWFHRFWAIDDPQQKMTQNAYFFRNVALLGGSLILFAVFATVGHDLSFTLTDPLFDLR
ncbi:MAG TPA: DoxX family protein [Actinomycetota bacterium]|jgi:putative oxidoreductase|nr:DoxX family protein [Actinomycetota bacterium]